MRHRSAWGQNRRRRQRHFGRDAQRRRVVLADGGGGSRRGCSIRGIRCFDRRGFGSSWRVGIRSSRDFTCGRGFCGRSFCWRGFGLGRSERFFDRTRRARRHGGDVARRHGDGVARPSLNFGGRRFFRRGDRSRWRFDTGLEWLGWADFLGQNRGRGGRAWQRRRHARGFRADRQGWRHAGGLCVRTDRQGWWQAARDSRSGRATRRNTLRGWSLGRIAARRWRRLATRGMRHHFERHRRGLSLGWRRWSRAPARWWRRTRCGHDQLFVFNARRGGRTRIPVPCHRPQGISPLTFRCNSSSRLAGADRLIF